MTSTYTLDIPDHQIIQARIDPNELKFDENAQRTLNKLRARKIADNLIPTALGTILVSERSDGSMYVIDGMHRAYACQLAAKDGVKGAASIFAEIHKGLTLQHEASLFIIKNRESAKVSPLDEYKVGKTAGHALYLDTERVITAHGLRMGNKSSNQIRGVKGVVRIVELYGPDILDQALTIAEAAWKRTPETWDSIILTGLAMVLHKHSDVVKPADLAIKLGRGSEAYHWLGKIRTAATGGGAHGDGTGGRNAAAYNIFVNEWDRGRKLNRIKPKTD
ncbi:DUF6551 family protein [Streptomyces sp. H34-S4]|uniref:DUF6551 family protein n=1 Tax=Streptomyces sp. H34-S4 TaxID=2996463 RepID=UPI00227096F7|nr:DUF6551 family protein [Streptomyces sp. H34-S4]MCY0938522.1 hypothetical protein [Streptomyces sp. H34-S4]